LQGLDLPQPVAGNQFFCLGERAVDQRAAFARKPYTLALGYLFSGSASGVGGDGRGGRSWRPAFLLS
jgi:hypothetical protein